MHLFYCFLNRNCKLVNTVTPFFKPLRSSVRPKRCSSVKMSKWRMNKQIGHFANHMFPTKIRLLHCQSLSVKEFSGISSQKLYTPSERGLQIQTFSGHVKSTSRHVTESCYGLQLFSLFVLGVAMAFTIGVGRTTSHVCKK